MSMKQVTTEELRRMKGCEGLVLQGCDGDLKEWQQSINDIFTDEGLLLDSTKFENIYVFQYSNPVSYHDTGLLLIPFNYIRQ